MLNPLDLGSTSSPQAGNPLELEPPKPMGEVVVQAPEKVGGMILVDADAQQKHAENAKSFLDDLLATPLQSPEFQTKLAQLTRLGEGTMQQASAASNRMLKRPAAALAATGADPASRTGNSLVELRQIVTELDPKRHDLTGTKRILKFLPGGSAIQRYFLKYESAQAATRRHHQGTQGWSGRTSARQCCHPDRTRCPLGGDGAVGELRRAREPPWERFGAAD